MAASSVARSPKTPERDASRRSLISDLSSCCSSVRMVYGDIGIELVNGLAHAGEDGGGVALGARINGHALHEIHLPVRAVEFVGNLVAHAFIAGVFDHADDFDVGLRARVAAHADVQPDR